MTGHVDDLEAVAASLPPYVPALARSGSPGPSAASVVARPVGEHAEFQDHALNRFLRVRIPKRARVSTPFVIVSGVRVSRPLPSANLGFMAR